MTFVPPNPQTQRYLSSDRPTSEPTTLSRPGFRRRITRFLERIFRRPRAPDTSRLCQLPLEIFLLTANELPLESQFLLSRTCRRARFNLHRDWPAELGRLPLKVQMRVLLQLAYDMPGHFACALCFMLHEVDFRYTPSNLDHSGWGFCREPTEYTRLGNTRTAYLEKLMKPWSYKRDEWSDNHDVDHRIQGPSPLAEKEYTVLDTARPRIVNGRFLHESAWGARHKFGGPIYWPDLPLAPPTGWTKHIYALAYMHEPLEHSEHFMRIAQEDTSVPPRPFSGSFFCHRCNMECHYGFGYSRWTFRAWRDLGSEIEPLRMEEFNEGRGSLTDLCYLSPSHRPGPIEATFNGWADEYIRGEGVVDSTMARLA